jgi:hypothetical protein
VISR